MNGIRDFLPAEPGSRLEYAYRMMAIEESRERRAEQERLSERAAQRQSTVDAAENAAYVSGRQPLTHLEILQTASQLADIEEAAAERRRSAPRADKHPFGDIAEVVPREVRLEEAAANLRSQRNALRSSEDLRLHVDRARATYEQRVADRYRRGSYR